VNKTARREYPQNFIVCPLYFDCAPAWANYLQKSDGKFLGFPDPKSWIAYTQFNRAQRELITKLSESLTADNRPASPCPMVGENAN
jgi:hypothetical protein